MRPSFVPGATFTSERRQAPRIEVTSPAWIEGARGRLVACTIVNFSVGGAQLSLSQEIVLPSRFALLLSKDGKSKHECCVVWRKLDQLGVRFVGL